MDLVPSAEQAEIAESSAAFLRARLPLARTRTMFGEASNIDHDAWSAAAELGWFGLGLAEEFGGIGCGLADEVMLFAEIGRCLASGPFLSTVLAARVAAFGGASTLAETIIAGAQPVGIAVADRADVFDDDGNVSGSLQLLDTSGEFVLVVDRSQAALLRLSDLANVTAVGSVDPAIRICVGEAHGVHPVAIVAAGTDAIEQRGRVLAAAMLAALTEQARDLSVEHAKNRVQFDRPIGVHQAIKHPCADMAVHAQLAVAQTRFAALAIDEHRADAEFQALSAHHVAAEAAEFAAATTVQIHGGMGVTSEHDAHLIVKRAMVLSALFGGSGARLARLWALPTPV